MKYVGGPFDGRTVNPKLVKAMSRLTTAVVVDSYGVGGLYTNMEDHFLYEGTESAESTEGLPHTRMPQPPTV